eukprot:3691643-Rhodomonas_salina.2
MIWPPAQQNAARPAPRLKRVQTQPLSSSSYAPARPCPVLSAAMLLPGCYSRCAPSSRPPLSPSKTNPRCRPAAVLRAS